MTPKLTARQFAEWFLDRPERWETRGAGVELLAKIVDERDRTWQRPPEPTPPGGLQRCERTCELWPRCACGDLAGAPPGGLRPADVETFATDLGRAIGFQPGSLAWNAAIGCMTELLERDRQSRGTP